MEALFDSDVILSDDPESKTIVCDCFKNGEPSLTIFLNDETRKAEKRAAKKHIRFDAKSVSTDGTAQGTMINEPEEYAYDVIEASYDHSDGFFTKDSKEVMLKFITDHSAFAQWLAGKLTEVFTGSHLLKRQQEEEKEKN
jgi:hypothetical protein